MKQNWRRWPSRFVRWLCGSPFRQLPAAYGSPVPTDLQIFQAEAEQAKRTGLGTVATPERAHHAITRPARNDASLERQ